MDWLSTIIQRDCHVEQNPIMRNIWCNHGDFGFTLASLSCMVMAVVVVDIGVRFGVKKFVISTVTILFTLKLLLALTNFGVVPYWVLSWWQY